ncbi:hypothetical protein CASFOL_003384 [Castilleja foliolosa]|uniref:Uncharacterized protein n=1 Tax=Castilleja foliolosa TaxID=1961234 RepID=A0ABD3EHB3_9LAMI
MIGDGGGDGRTRYARDGRGCGCDGDGSGCGGDGRRREDGGDGCGGDGRGGGGDVTDHVKGHLKGKPQGDIYTPRNISNPASPVGSPLPHPRSPLIGQNGVYQYPHLKRSLLPPETIRNLPKHTPGVNGPSYWDPNILRKVYSGDNDDSHHRKQFAFTASRKVEINKFI